MPNKVITTLDMVGMLQQSQALIIRINDLTKQLDALNRAMFPPVTGHKKMPSPKEMRAELTKRLKDRDRKEQGHYK